MSLAPTQTNSTTLAALKESTKNLPPDTPLSFYSAGGLALMQRAAGLLSCSTLVPNAYRDTYERKIDKYKTEFVKNPNALSNCVLALNMAQRLGADPLMIMQNLYIVEGRPSWSSQFVIASINACGKFSPLRFKMEDLGEKEVEWKTTKWVDGPNGKRVPNEEIHTEKIRNKACTAWAIEKATGDKIDGPTISIETAVAEGWYGKNGSKWQTIPDIMLRYRAASFFGKLYAPELLMGLQTAEEVQDAVITVEQGDSGVYEMTMDELATSSQKPDKSGQRKSGRKNAAQSAPEKDDAEKPDAGPQETTVKPEQADNPDTAASPRAAPLPDDEDGPPIPCPNRNDALVSPDTCFYCEERKGCPAHDK